jgi:hypothetical protein
MTPATSAAPIQLFMRRLLQQSNGDKRSVIMPVS